VGEPSNESLPGTLCDSLRIALLTYRGTPTCGGQGVYIRHLSRELVALGHQVEVFSGQPYPVLDEDVRLTKVPSLDLYAEPNPFRIPLPWEFKTRIDVREFALMCTGAFPEPLTTSLRTYEVLKPSTWTGGRRYDIVHDNQGLGTGLTRLREALAPLGVPVVATIHHPITVDRRHDLAAARNPWQRLTKRRWYSFLPMQQKVARGLDGILTVSDLSLADIPAEMGILPERVHMVPLGVDPAVFCPGPGTAVPGRILVVTSADVPMKGLMVLLDALAKLRVERPDAHLVCIGRAKPNGLADRRLDELSLRDAVTFRSGLTQDELVALMRSAEVAAVPSFYEGFCLPAVEEMACGLPLVATRVGALPEIVGSDEKAGLLVPPGDAEALAAALGGLLDSPERRATLGAAARRRVEERFTWRAAAAGTVEWYRERIAAMKGGAPGSVPEQPTIPQVAAPC
jgi:glycosyltransferase involved in cell wall biosynthesis